MGKIYIVPTPVGNLDDMTPRAVEVLRNASLILAEDTRTSAVLMRHFDIRFMRRTINTTNTPPSGQCSTASRPARTSPL